MAKNKTERCIGQTVYFTGQVLNIVTYLGYIIDVSP